MTKQALKGVTMLVLIISIAFITAVISANAQAPGSLTPAKHNSETQTVNIPASLQ
ncbi:MAG TPA: hypothetical protein VGO91_03940 [Pyrinomonadaceae bacterium]|jgi:hypothetical protein|nr:hypothetical protein [Pyrinomonadaceae bacterium]